MPAAPAFHERVIGLAPYACRPNKTRGRIHDEPESARRTCYQRDRDRIIHARAFRRLKHKTQVFIATEGDHYRTRLTHSLEVAQIARTMARALNVNEDLVEALALAHDLGHPPFAHTGEDVLAELMEPYGGFDHNLQTLRVVTEIEHVYPKWRGLNLTVETLEGMIKHNGPVKKDMPAGIKEFAQKMGVDLNLHTPLEEQIVGLADDIAYCNHDVEDGLRAGFFTVADLAGLALYGPVIEHVRKIYGDLPEQVFCAEIIREQVGAMVEDVLTTTEANLASLKPDSVDAVRHAGYPLVRFSDDMFLKVKELRNFLFERMYRHPDLNRFKKLVERVIKGLFLSFMGDPALLPEPWQERAGDGQMILARTVADYIAGMTDGFALKEYERLFNLSLEIR